MYDFMLTLHFIGLAMGVGTGFAMMFLGIAAGKMEKSEASNFMLKATFVSNAGKIGLVLLIISGVYLMNNQWSLLETSTYFQIKLAAVLLLTVLIGMMESYVKNAKKGNAELYLGKMEKLGKITLPLGILIIVMAVLTFH